MPNTTSITLDLDFTRHLVRMSAGGDEPIMEGPITVEDLIIEAAARVMFEQAWRDATTCQAIARKVDDMIDATIAAKVVGVVDDLLTTPRQPTNNFGQPKGDPITLAEQIEESVQKALIRRTQIRRSGSVTDVQEMTVVERAVANEVERTVGREVKAAVGAERDAIVAKVAAGAAQVLTAGLTKALDT